VLLAELLWKDTYPLHDSLLRSLVSLLHPQGQAMLAMVHRPTPVHTPQHDMEFLSRAQAHGLEYTHLGVVSRYQDLWDEKFAEVHLYSLQYPQYRSRDYPKSQIRALVLP